jgi:hypothetical protein
VTVKLPLKTVGLETTDQVAPFHAIVVLPPATQNDVLTQVTEYITLTYLLALFGLVRIDHSLPFHAIANELFL